MDPVTGIQTPRFIHTPSAVVGNEAQDAIDLCAAIGMPLDEWQQIALQAWLGVRTDGYWAAQTAGIVVARQQGKNALLEARELAGLFLFGEHRIVHSAHQAATADEAFKRMRNLIEGVPWLDSEVAKILGSPGRQSIRLKSGAELSYRTRTKGGARGFSAPIVIFDEAQELSGEQIAAIIPVTSSFPNRQLIYTGTVLEGATVFRGLVERGRKQMGDALGYVEWSAPEECESDDVEAWRQANPAIGIRIELDYVRNELDTFRSAGAEDKWRQERLSIWPASDTAGSVIPLDAWAKCQDERGAFSKDSTKQAVGVAVSPDRDYAAVGIAEKRPDGKTYVEVVALSGYELGATARFPKGVDWLLPYLVERVGVRKPETVVIDKGGPAFSLATGMLLAKLPVKVTETADYKTACGQFVDAVKAGRIVHRGQTPLDTAAFGVKEHRVGDAWVYARRDSGVLVAPLEAVTLAVWGLNPDPKKKTFAMVDWAAIYPEQEQPE